MPEHGFTRGPWAVSKNKARRVTSSGVIICNAVMRNQGGPKHKAFLKDEQEAEANARLIAASPTLLEALIAAESLFNHTFAMNGTIHKQIRAAITLATGKDA